MPDQLGPADQLDGGPAAPGGERGDHLRRVDHGAAAERDDAVAARIAVHRVGRVSSGGGRVLRNVQVSRHGAGQQPEHGGDGADPIEATVADHERMFDTERRQLVRQRGQRAGPEGEARQREYSDHSERPSFDDGEFPSPCVAI